MVKSEDFLPAASGLDGIEWTEDTPKLILSYGDAAAERHSALTGAFLKDVRAARVIRTEGENGEKLLRRLITAGVAKHATGDCLLASMLNASGGVMQEVAVIAHTGYWDVVLFPETADTGLAWSRQVAVSFEAEVEQPEDRHVFWLGGPLASDTLKKVDCAVPKAGSFTEPEAGVQVCAFEDIFLIQGETAKLDAFWKRPVPLRSVKKPGKPPARRSAFPLLAVITTNPPLRLKWVLARQSTSLIRPVCSSDAP